jgi:hypothetical protein
MFIQLAIKFHSKLSEARTRKQSANKIQYIQYNNIYNIFSFLSCTCEFDLLRPIYGYTFKFFFSNYAQ